MGARPLVLLADDDDVYRGTLERALQRRGWEVRAAASPAAAIAIADVEPVAYAAVDLRMPGATGLELVRALLERRPACVLVVVTGYGSIATAVEAVKRGAAHYLAKPITADDLVAAFERSATSAPPPIDHDVPSLARAEWEHIQRVLADCNGNVSRAARLLKVERKTLQRKLAKAPAPR